MRYLLALKSMKKIQILFLGLFLLVSLGSVAQSEIPAKPDAYVLDLSSKLSATEKTTLEQKLRGYADSTSTQFAIVIVPSTEGRDPYDYAMEIAQTWGVGQKEKNNGVVILIAASDRKIRIVTGRGIEDVLPDAICKRIINKILKPALKQDQYFVGLDLATTEMMQRASGSFVNDDPLGSESTGIPPVLIFFLIFVVFSIINGFRNRGGGRGGPGSRGGGMFFPPIFLGGGGSGGGSFGGGGGSSFGGFGGGSFGGGGAGGDF
jgi:uncharacterized protein